VEYCTVVVDQSFKEKREVLENENVDPGQRRLIQTAVYASQVKVQGCFEILTACKAHCLLHSGTKYTTR